ncbi:unnamed protein product [Hymenolepis diminuta]|uniref:DUF7041 domain-containing protein n=1 Tax=Hymenolepis diminuta TaxID=6216 RepID=A0A564YAJ2_HYMDI|nr:unnamed protein product [Hymenolepis diminuta]
MSNELEPAVKAVGAPITCPVFDPRNSYVWFRQLENNFQLRGITKQKIMFPHTFPALPTDVAAEIIDIVDKAPENNEVINKPSPLSIFLVLTTLGIVQLIWE